MNKWIVKIITCIVLLLCFNSCKVGRFFVYNFADIKDHKKFPSRKLVAPTEKFSFHTSENGKAPKNINLGNREIPFESFLENNKTVAFLIIQNDTIQCESYFYKYKESSIVPSFSMAKSITSILIGCAIDDKLIKSVNEPITNYIPELKKNGFDKVTIEHVLQMTTGIKYNEGYYNPFGDVATFYYGRNLRRAISKMQLETNPGREFKYASGNTQLLGLILERALENRTVTEYLQEKIWSQIGMEFDASWSLDKKKGGLEKTFCCLNARAKDFAKIGRLLLNKGNWNGKQIVSEQWVNHSTKLDRSNGSAGYYQYQWWRIPKTGDFMAQGILGQYIYINPNKNLIIVRLGKNTGNTDWWNNFVSIASNY